MTQPCSPRRDREAGVSLVEVLVVLVLVGVMAGAIGLSLGGRGQGDVAAREARVLAARLTRASDEALLTGTPVAVVWSSEAYRLVRFVDGDWQAFDISLLIARYDLPRGVRLAAGGGAGTLSAGGSFVVRGDLQPQGGLPLALSLMPDGGVPTVVHFDGARAWIGDAT